MTRIVAHQIPTIDELRDRLKKVMAKVRTTRHDCPKCGGKGYLEKKAPMSALEVQRQSGVPNVSLGNFLKGKYTMSLEKGLKLIAWLDSVERDELAELDAEHQPRGDKTADPRRLAAELTSRAAAASGAIDAMHRPPVFKGPKQVLGDGSRV